MRSKLTRRGQTVVPSAIRKRFNLDESSSLQWMAEGDLITVFPLPPNPVEALKGAIKGEVSFEDFIKDRQTDREIEKRKDASR